MARVKLPASDAELYYRNKVMEPAETQAVLAEKCDCHPNTIGRRVRKFQDLVDSDDSKALTELRIIQREAEEYDDLEDELDFMDSESYSEELEARTDAPPEYYQGEEATEEEYLNTQEETATDMMPVGVRKGNKSISEEEFNKILRGDYKGRKVTATEYVMLPWYKKAWHKFLNWIDRVFL